MSAGRILNNCVSKIKNRRLYVKQSVVGKSNSFQRFLTEQVPLTNKAFSPTLWLYGSRLQTIYATFLRKDPPFKYSREYIINDDGGEFAVDWAFDSSIDSSPTAVHSNQPIVILLPGLSGHSESRYIRHCVYQVMQNGYRCVVLNYRGNAGLKLKTPRTNCATSFEDISYVIQKIRRDYPCSPLIGCGISFGGATLFNYLAHNGNNVHLEAAMLISVPFHADASSLSLEQPLNRFLFNRHIVSVLRGIVKNNAHVFEGHIDIEAVLKSRTIREFDQNITAKIFGYPDAASYYEDASLATKINKISIPILCLTSADDQFVPYQSLPLKEISESNYFALLITPTGGHNGFLEGFWPSGPNYADRLLREFTAAIVNNLSFIRQIRCASVPGSVPLSSITSSPLIKPTTLNSQIVIKPPLI